MERIIILGHQNPDIDSIVSGYLLEKVLLQKGYNVSFIIPDKKLDKNTIEICSKFKLDYKKYQKELPKDFCRYILVDHNDRNVNGKIIGIIDHHPTYRKIDIKYYYNKKASSTSCIICQGNEKYFDDNDLQLAFVAAMVDTASFHSSKGRQKDLDWIRKECSKRKLDYNIIYQQGLLLTPLDNLKRASLNGLKHYSIDNIEFEASYVQVKDDKAKNVYKIIDKLKKYYKENNLHCFVFIVHNMKKFTSTVYILRDKDIKHKKYDHYASRADEIIPDIIRLLKK